MPIQPITETKDRSTNIHIAVLYAKADQEAWEELEKQFTSINARYPNVHIWTATDIDIGGSVERQLKDELKRADITLLLFSPEFVNDDIVDEEVRDLLTTYARFSDSDAYRKEERFIMPILLNHLYGWDDIYDKHFDIENLRVFDKLPEANEDRGKVYESIAQSLEEYIVRINAKSVQIALPTWIGFIPSIMYNGGFARNEDTPLFQKYRREVHFELNDHLDQLCEDFKAGQIDMMWCTIDRLPYVADKIKEWSPKVFYQASWSNGADAILSRSRIETVADLRGKRILYPQDSPSHTFLKYVLQEHGIQPGEVEAIPQKHTDLDLLTKRFIKDDTLDALVLWSPFVEACIAEGCGDIKVLTDSSDYPNLIADVLLTSEEYINLNREEITELLKGWFREVDHFLNDEYYPQKAVGVLVNAIIKPLPSIIPSSIRGSLESALNNYFQTSLNKVHLCDLADNRRFFGIGNQEKGNAQDGEALYTQFLKRQYPHLVNDPGLQWSALSDTSLLNAL